MCGIAGAVNWGDRTVLQRMTDVQSHRGPDDEGIWETWAEEETWVGLGSRRLSILDLSPAGHMPMSDEEGTLRIAYNGEVYNYRQLREELCSKGVRFRSHTDTEVILRLYEREGPACLHRLNGMFAIAIWDARRQELFLARDHFGVKPLYYAHQGRRFAFASEIKSLLELPEMPREVDLEALHQFLTLLWVPDPKTMLRGVYKLPPGHYALFRRGELTTVQYWDLVFPPAEHRYDLPVAELTEGVRAHVQRAVKAQMVSDVPVGAFLSSGLDSATIVAMMSAATPRPVSTYTIGFPPQYCRGEITLDDVSAARRLAQRFGCRHTEISVRPDVTDLLPKIVWHLDEPIADPAAIAAYLICREARQSTTVLLSGVGGDELFAGYRKYVGHSLAERYCKIPRAIRCHAIEPFIERLPVFRGTPLKGYVRLAKKLARGGSLSPEERFLMGSVYLTEAQKAQLYRSDVAAQVNGFDPWERHREYFGRVGDAAFLNRMLYLDTKAFMVSLNLTYNDKMSMASSVEVRVPFLDRELWEFVAWNVSPSLKLHGHTTKHILRKAMEGVLPREVLHGRKAGFGAPVDYWLAHDLRPMVDELLSEQRIQRRGYFDPAVVRTMVEEQRKGRQDWSYQVWQLLTLELWLETFLDRPPQSSPAAGSVPAAAASRATAGVGGAKP
jgi:asparagine synthase (glutamine-hydrolysing)